MAMAKCSKSRNSETGGKVQHILRFFSSKNGFGGGMDDGWEPKRRIPHGKDESGIFTDP